MGGMNALVRWPRALAERPQPAKVSRSAALALVCHRTVCPPGEGLLPPLGWGDGPSGARGFHSQAKWGSSRRNRLEFKKKICFA